MLSVVLGSLCMGGCAGSAMVDPDVRNTWVELSNNSDQDASVTVRQHLGGPGLYELPRGSTVRLQLHGVEPDKRPSVEVSASGEAKGRELPLEPGFRHLDEAREHMQRFVIETQPPGGLKVRKAP
jgi:hypothetical protein